MYVVSILVIVDVALKEGIIESEKKIKGGVSILVIVDVTLKESKSYKSAFHLTFSNFKNSLELSFSFKITIKPCFF